MAASQLQHPPGTLLRVVVFCARFRSILFYTLGVHDNSRTGFERRISLPPCSMALCNHFVVIRGLDGARFCLVLASRLKVNGRPWMWASGHSADSVRRSTHGYEPARVAAIAAFK
jgi:hypothetical protein